MPIQQISRLIFRELTPADFFNINKRSIPGATGGGQSYIDIPTSNVSIDDWKSFFDKIAMKETKSGPLWQVRINSLGGLGHQIVEIGQRRPASVNIRSQKLHSKQSNRILAWHPEHGDFPRAQTDITSADDSSVIESTLGLRIFLAKTATGEYWAGWFKSEYAEYLRDQDTRFDVLFSQSAGGLIEFNPQVSLNTDKLQGTFVFARQKQAFVHSPPYNAKSNRRIEDIDNDLFDEDCESKATTKTPKLVNLFKRNTKAARKLRNLYKKCQISGDKFVFNKINGEPYLEVHHLIPLGHGGDDNPANLIVVSAHIHRMLHYGSVEGLDLNKIKNNQLNFKINNEDFTITWHPNHARLINQIDS